MVIIGINVAVWVAILATGGAPAAARLPRLRPTGCAYVRGQGGCEITRARARSSSEQLVPAGVADGAYWQLITSAFTHVEIWHIGFNMLALWVLGPQLELAIGAPVHRAVPALGARRLDLGLLGQRRVRPTLGASGAVFGLMGPCSSSPTRSRPTLTGPRVDRINAC
jgi:membrane associated rhomboid family serine protease